MDMPHGEIRSIRSTSVTIRDHIPSPSPNAAFQTNAMRGNAVTNWQCASQIDEKNLIS